MQRPVRAARGVVLGQRLQNFSIVRLLGEGGMSSVYEAEHSVIRRKVAVKVLRSELSADGAQVQRFFNEARAASAIRHPNIVEVIDLGRLPDGVPYLVMELLEGECLADRLERVGSLDIASAVEVAYQAASALEAAHALDVVHRDLKPDNLFLVPDPRLPDHELVKVLDFGIAKLRGELAAPPFDTLVGEVLGTPPYMSPEQCRGVPEEVDQRTDIYALGIILYEMICGRPPFLAPGAGELMLLHMTEAPEPPSLWCPEIPPALERTILCALAKRREDRYASMSDLKATLAELGVALGILEEPAAPRSRPVTIGGGLRGPVPAPAFESDTTLTAPKLAPRASSPPRERAVTREQLRSETSQPEVASSALTADAGQLEHTRADPEAEAEAEELPAQLVTEEPASESDLSTTEPDGGDLQPQRAAPAPQPRRLVRASWTLVAAVALVLLETSIHIPRETAYQPARSGRVAPPAEDHVTRQAKLAGEAPLQPTAAEAIEPGLQSVGETPAPPAEPAAATAPAATLPPAAVLERKPRRGAARPNRRSRARQAAAPAKSTPPLSAAEAAPPAVATPPLAPGYLNLESSPRFDVFLGTLRLGTTPLRRFPLPPGRHLLTLKNPELGQSASYAVEIESGRTVSRVVGSENR